MNLKEAEEKIREEGTHGVNFGVSPEDIIDKLRLWAGISQFTIDEIKRDGLRITFQKLPEDLESFCEDVYSFCPDTIDQGYGCLGEFIDASDDIGEEVPEEMLELAEGIDFESEDFGVEIMKRDLIREGILILWWD
ncbi:MAG: DUF4253 domain-containing protein [Sedimentisphaerales bacterium]|nr:DUF4253 domain-containing protein [Sedimentisphaerales bacterium]